MSDGCGYEIAVERNQSRVKIAAALHLPVQVFLHKGFILLLQLFHVMQWSQFNEQTKTKHTHNVID